VEGSREMERILVIEAHYDDMAFGCFATIKKLQREQNAEVYVYTVCLRRRCDDSDRRAEIAKKFYDENLMWSNKPNHYDTELNLASVSEIVPGVMDVINNFKPTIIMFPEKDLHPDHMIVNSIGRIVSRPTPDQIFIKEVWEYSIPSSRKWDFGNPDSLIGHKVIAVGKHWKDKIVAILLFSDELKKYPDMRSTKAITNLLEADGNIFGLGYAEVHKILYSRG
jgi:hypothetical protein